MNTKLNMATIPADKLNPAKYNPRKNLKKGDKEYEKIKRSIESFGFVEPIIWNEYTGNIVGGHQRYKILTDAGAKDIECVVVHIENPEDEKALNIALNKAKGDWDEKALAQILAEMREKGYEIIKTGFDLDEADELIDKIKEPAGREDSFDVAAELKKPPMSRNGDVWALGRHRLVCGDSTARDTYKALMQGEKANLVLTDPPYNVNYEGSAGKIQNDNMSDASFYSFLYDAYSRMEENMEDEAFIYVFHADTEGLNFRKAFIDAGFHLGGCCIWKKPSLVLGRSPYQWQHEPVLYGWKNRHEPKWYAQEAPKTIWEFEKSKKNGAHPTMKPIPLLCYPINNSTEPNAIVLDPFGGSGSTLIACEQTGRVCRTIELDEKFSDVIVNRYIEYVGTDEEVFVTRDGKEYAYSEVKR